MQVRLAHAGDGQRVFEHLVLNKMHQENALPQAPLDIEKAFATIMDLASSQGKRGIILLAEDDEGNVIGSIGAEFQQASWFSSALVLYERWVYVDPGHRHTSAALRMLKLLDEYGKGLGVPVCCGIMVNEDIDRKAKVFARIFKKSGYMFTGGSEKPFDPKEYS